MPQLRFARPNAPQAAVVATARGLTPAGPGGQLAGSYGINLGARDMQGVPFTLYSPKLSLLARQAVRPNVFPQKAYGASGSGLVGTRYGMNFFAASMVAQTQRNPRTWNAYQIKHG